MKYKVLTLILLIPLVLMVCVFSAANFTSLKIPISVNSVAVYHERLEVINLAENNTFQINAQVMPINASNKGLIYTYESVNGKQLPNLEIDEHGFVKASGFGTAKVVVTTKDGAYKKSFLLEVTSTVATELVANLSAEDDIFAGDEFEILTTVLPEAALDKNVKFSSSDNNIVKIDPITGKCKALSSGRVELKATLENGISGKIEKSFNVLVMPNSSLNPVSFNGAQNLEDNIFSDNYSVIMEVNFLDLHNLGFELSKTDILLNYDNSTVDSINLEEISKDNGIYKYKLEINGVLGEEFNLSVKLNYENYESYSSTIKLNKIVDLQDLEIRLVNFKNYIKLNATNQFKIEILPQDFSGYNLEVSFENSNIMLIENSGVYYYKGTAVGSNKLIVKVFYEGEMIAQISRDVEILNPPTSLDFVANTENYGIEDLLTLGNQKIVLGEYVEKRTMFDFVADVNLEDIEFSVDDEGIAKFVDGELVVLNEGKVTIQAKEKKSALLGVDLMCEITVRCVKGVEVGSYKDLVQATEEGKPVVLTQDIMLGEELVKVNPNGTTTLLKSKEECAQILKSEVKQIETTAEWDYYKYYKNYTTPPTINYIIKFTNNVYGNGYFLNANNITNMVDATNSLREFAVFRGPLNLVAIPDASVKAQDNICFIASDNVMINNVELIGANLNGIETTDLAGLNYVGTVLEVMGDNVKIVNSRIKNGRNCVRVFGKESGQEDEKINVLIESCVISNAREFLIKMGTNRKITGEFKNADKIDLADGNLSESTWEECAPSIENFKHLNDGTLTEQEYNALVEEYKNSTDFQNLIMTNLTLKNSVLHTSGLFSVGIETSFAGPALDGGKFSSWNFAEYGWIDIAGTSYPTQLNLEGDVRIYDWKKLSNIDTSILIDGDMFDLDLAQMINDVYSNGGFTDIITEVGNEKFAHGGIVMYGGGKNYCLVNNNMTSAELGNYSIGLDSLNSALTSILKYASGKENFRMFMYGKNSDFNYYKQVADLQSGDAYNSLGKYIF